MDLKVGIILLVWVCMWPYGPVVLEIEVGIISLVCSGHVDGGGGGGGGETTPETTEILTHICSSS